MQTRCEDVNDKENIDGDFSSEDGGLRRDGRLAVHGGAAGRGDGDF